GAKRQRWVDDGGLSNPRYRAKIGPATDTKGGTMLTHFPRMAAAALLIALTGEASAQTQTPPDPGAAANIRQSQQYDHAVQSNSVFRAKRVKQECGPITDPELHASCVASFGGDGAPPASKRRHR